MYGASILFSCPLLALSVSLFLLFLLLPLRHMRIPIVSQVTNPPGTTVSTPSLSRQQLLTHVSALHRPPHSTKKPTCHKNPLVAPSLAARDHTPQVRRIRTNPQLSLILAGARRACLPCAVSQSTASILARAFPLSTKFRHYISLPRPLTVLSSSPPFFSTNILSTYLHPPGQPKKNTSVQVHPPHIRTSKKPLAHHGCHTAAVPRSPGQRQQLDLFCQGRPLPRPPFFFFFYLFSLLRIGKV